MKNALDWIKNNPISAASIVIAFLGFVVFVFVLFVKAPGLNDRVVEDNTKPANDLQQLTTNRVELPNPDPNEPPISITGLVINQDMIDFVEVVNRQIQGQSDGIKNSTRNLNARAHENYTFVNGTVFGKNADPTPAQIVAASEDYRNSFDAMFTEGHESLNMPKLLVGMPPRLEVIQEAVFQTLVDYLQSVGATQTSDLTQAQAQELYQLQQVAVMEILASRAEEIQLYADALPLPVETEEEQGQGQGQGLGQGPSVGFNRNNNQPQGARSGMDRYSADYPFEIAPWAFAAEQATLDQLWEGQVQIWITRDIMRAITIANSTVDEQPNGNPVYTPVAVIEAPIKRLLELEVLPGYVGLHSGGGVDGAAGSTGGRSGSSGGRPGAAGGFTGQMAPGGPGMMEPGMPGPGGPSGPGGPGGVQPGPGGSAGVATPQAEVSQVYGSPALATLPTPQQPIVDSFFFGPTGRYSNSVFDVRHARLVIHIEWAKLPEFQDILRRVNFMSVIDMTLRDIDEYQQLANGYVYGTQDVVEVELIIETLWYRSWTADLMPQIVRDALLVQDAPQPLN